MTVLEFIKSVRKRLEKATPGPWTVGYWAGKCRKDHLHASNDGPCDYEYTLKDKTEFSHHYISQVTGLITLVTTTDEYGAMSKPDAQLIAAAPTDLERALKIIEVYREALTNISLETHTPYGRESTEALAKADEIGGEKLIKFIEETKYIASEHSFDENADLLGLPVARQIEEMKKTNPKQRIGVVTNIDVDEKTLTIGVKADEIAGG